jgi:copper chaperone CopZ
MKAFKIFSLAVLALVIASCSHTIEESANTEETQTEAKVAVVANDAVDMKVEGMVCVNGCKGAIEKSLNGMAGIEACEIDFEKGIAHVSFDNAQISDVEIQKAIENVNDGAYSAEFITEMETEETPEVPTEEANTAS